jgi:hypothetical protein
MLLDAGEATRGLNVTARGGHLIVGRTDDYGPDSRFRLTPLGGGAYGLSLYRRKRWEPLPFEGSLEELADTTNHELGLLGCRLVLIFENQPPNLCLDRYRNLRDGALTVGLAGRGSSRA